MSLSQIVAKIGWVNIPHHAVKLGSKERNKNQALLLCPLSAISPNGTEIWTGKSLIKNNEKNYEGDASKEIKIIKLELKMTNTSQCETLRAVYFFIWVTGRFVPGRVFEK